MTPSIRLSEIIIRTDLRPGDIGYIVFLHGSLYHLEYNYGIEFETYVAAGLVEFYQLYNADKDGVWICEHENKIVGFLLAMHREESVQLRYFILLPEYRGIGLGNKLLGLVMDFLKEHNYKRPFLWTTHELDAAAHLYKKFGFRLSEEKASTSFGKVLTEQRYDLDLNTQD